MLACVTGRRCNDLTGQILIHIWSADTAFQAVRNAFDGGPVQPRTIGLDQSVQMTKQLVWDLDQLVQHLDRLFGLLVETVCRV